MGTTLFGKEALEEATKTMESSCQDKTKEVVKCAYLGLDSSDTRDTGSNRRSSFLWKRGGRWQQEKKTPVHSFNQGNT